MTKALKNLALKLQNLPASPGVYMFKNTQGKIIYIGKAKNLRNRVRSYFQDGNRHDLKTFRLVSKIADLELLVTENEVESLILEANLVREHKPRYNIMLKDDKHFPYIKITTGESFPRVLIVRRLEKDKAVYFGPYTSSLNMRKTVTFLTRLFRIRTCNYVIPPPEGKKYQVCLDYHIDRCKGPCEGLQSEEDYREQVNAVMMILSGKSKKLLDRLSKKMFAASEAMRFEEARLYRDQIEAIKAVIVKQSADVGEVIDRDIVSIVREARDAVAVIMQIREGVLIGRQDFQLLADENDSEEAVLEAFLTQYYNHQPNLPEEIFIPMELAEVAVMEKWLKAVKGSAIKIVTPRIGSKVKLVDLAAKNARLLLDELLIQKRGHQERISKMVTALKDELKLAVSPKTMVCFDISNTGETDAVGACVYFENGKPRKNEYRHFKIKGVAGQDDFTMIREVVGRYFYRLQSEKLTPPDLVVVDGGKGQLSSTLAELKSLGFDNQPVIALAKRLEEVYLPFRSDPITIGKSSPALILLKRIRDEAHRFAINYNRKVRSRRTIQSALDSVPGIGPAKRALLLQTFGSVVRIQKATLEELTAVKGINEKLARTILENLNKL